MSCPQIWYIGQEKDRGKEKEGGRKAKLNKKKGDRDLGQEIKKKQRRHFLVGRTTRKFCSRGDKMRNASSHQCKVKMSGSEKKGSTKTRMTFLPKNVELRSFWKFHIVVMQNNGKEMYKKSVLHMQSCLLAD